MSGNFSLATPVLAICGWSGAGKTTLIESLLPRFQSEGLAVGVWKRDAHHLHLDREGKDTDRFYRAGAVSVLGEDLDQCFLRLHKEGVRDSSDLLKGFPLDLLLVEGHKSSSLPKIWLEGPLGSEPCPSQLENCLRKFPRSDTLAQDAFEFIRSFLSDEWRRKRVRIAILVGGESKRMGRPKALLEIEGVTLLERTLKRIEGEEGAEVVLSGKGPIPDGLRDRYPVLPDVEGGASPLSGILSLLRWDPNSAWIVLGCDLPEMNQEYVDWLKSNRGPGKWAIAPRLSGEDRLQPLAALYEPQMAPSLEAAWNSGGRSLQKILNEVSIDSPVVPGNLESHLLNINTPEDWEEYVSKVHQVSEQV